MPFSLLRPCTDFLWFRVATFSYVEFRTYQTLHGACLLIIFHYLYEIQSNKAFFILSGNSNYFKGYHEILRQFIFITKQMPHSCNLRRENWRLMQKQMKNVRILTSKTVSFRGHGTWQSCSLLYSAYSSCSRAAIFNWCAARIFKTCSTWLFSQQHWPLFP